jgi:hypothetical protein
VLRELVIDAIDLGFLHGRGCGRLGHLLLSRTGLNQRQGRAAAAELGVNRLELGLGILELIHGAGATLREPAKPGQPAFGIGQPGFEARHESPCLVDFLGA